MPDVDILVAGAGAAGLAAGLTAAERGATVVIAESNPTFRSDSNTAMSTSMIPAGGSRWQREAGIDDSPQTFLDDVMAKTHGEANQTVARALVEVAPELVAWLADHVKVPLGLVTDFNYPGHSVHRCHAVPDRSGASLHGHMIRAAEESGITVMVPMRLSELIVDDGRVVGGVLSNPDGVSEAVSASSVILATNGFAGEPAMVDEYIPEMSDALYFGGHGSRGDAVTMARLLDLDLADMGAYQGHGSVATPHGVLVTWATVMHGGIIVNRAGLRFADETIGYSEFARLVLDQDGGEAWMIIDSAIDEACRPFADYQDLLTAGAVKWASDVSELADAVRVDSGALARTLKEAKVAAVGERADKLGRTNWESALEPPFGAVKITGALFHTQGGIAVDGRGRALRGGQPVPGLFAAGGAAVGMSGTGADGYMAGNGLLAALGLGFLAGRTAAEGG